jgi:transcription antitermination factor NusG
MREEITAAGNIRVDPMSKKNRRAPCAHFGDYVATIDSSTVAALQEQAGEEEIVTIDPDIQVGQAVRIAEGPFQGLEALVTHLLPGKERIRLLLDFLGRSLETEVPTPKVLPLVSPRA